jgi:hypothetical protein
VEVDPTFLIFIHLLFNFKKMLRCHRHPAVLTSVVFRACFFSAAVMMMSNNYNDGQHGVSTCESLTAARATNRRCTFEPQL